MTWSREQQAAYAARNRDNPEWVAQQNASKAEWRRRNNLATRAHTRVSRALREGALVKPETCRCGGSENIQAHHPDYAKPLEVAWLCPLCHKAEHRPA